MDKDLSTWPVKKLKDKLHELGLKVSGNKAELIQRIQDYGSSKSEYSNITVKQLKAVLKERKLSQTGRKVDLVNRLEVSDTKKIQTPLGRSPSPNKVFPRRETSPKIRNTPSPQQPIDELPTELFSEIINNLNDKDLANACKTDKRAAKLCKDDHFWNLRIQKVYNSNLNNYIEEDKTYREVYIDLKKYERKSKENLLTKTAELGYLPIVKYVVEKGANIHDSEDYTLRWAAQHGYLPMTKYLVEHSANIHARNDAALRGAAQYGHLPIVKYLVEHSANIHARKDSALGLAAHNGYLPVVKYLVEHSANIHADDDYALRFAAYHSHLPVVKYLMENGANIHSIDDYPLLWGMRKYNLSVGQYLVENGANIDVSRPNRQGLMMS